MFIPKNSNLGFLKRNFTNQKSLTVLTSEFLIHSITQLKAQCPSVRNTFNILELSRVDSLLNWTI
jgi:hypothetical protein